MLKATLSVFCALLFARVGADGTYTIVAPDTLQPGSEYAISLEILNASSSVFIAASVEEQVYNGLTSRYDINVLLNASGTFETGSVGILTLEIPTDFECQGCRLRIRGTGGLQFERVTHISVNFHVAVIFVQTDKPIYKPSQIVHFRVFAVLQDLTLHVGRFNIEVRDPNNNKIKLISNATSPSHVIEDSLTLSDQPVFGTWTIYVNTVDLPESYTLPFEVSQYVLPKFEVKVKLEPYALLSDTVLTGTVEAKYTFGQPVKGFVELHVGPNQGPNSCGVLPKTVNIGFEIDGVATFTIPKEDIQRAVSLYNNQEVRITAFVTEENTGVRLNGSEVIRWYEKKYQVEFADNTASVFKPGLPYIVYIRVSTPDKKPPKEDNITVSVYTSVTYQLVFDDQSLYDIAQFTGTYGLPGKNVTLPASGLLTLEIDIPSNATRITIKATVAGVQATKTVEKMFSPSSNYIQLTVLNKNIKSDSTVSIRVDGTEPLNLLNYKVLSRGSIVAYGRLDGKGQRSLTFSLSVTPDYGPVAYLIVYYSRGAKELVADTVAFQVDDIYKNDVTISFNKNVSEPNKEITLIVTAEPESFVFVTAIDQSVLLLKEANDITQDKVKDRVSTFNRGSKPTDSEFALSLSATSVAESFRSAGLLILTDVSLPSPPPVFGRRYGMPVYDAQPLMAMRGPPGPPGLDGPVLRKTFGESLKVVEQIRQFFPEVWLMTKAITRENGTASIQSTVPDTITSWVASAFATHPTAGLGVAPTTAKLTVFRSFFVEVNLPNTVIRGEQIVIQAVVFNYLPSDTDVVVTLKGSSTFQSVIPVSRDLESIESGDQVQQAKVESDKQATFYFPILADQIGVIVIEILAQSTLAADGIRRTIIVRPEGAPVNFNYPVFVNLVEGNNGFQDTVKIPLPDSLVNGSDTARIKAIGDLIGINVDSLDVLIQLPTGCGEQNLVHFAPDYYIGLYLESVGLLTPQLRDKIICFLNAGYQRQLTYQRYDGSFSAFGNSDESGSTWLTAYTARVVIEASHFIYIDPQVPVRAIDWLVDRQNKDGSFNEFGKVLDSNTQGTGTGASLTAFVLLAFLKSSALAAVDCQPQIVDCYRVNSWGNATANAIRNLENLAESNSINDQFSLALVSYALTLAHSKSADTTLKKLESFAHREGGLLFWSDNSTVRDNQGSEFRIWRPPRDQARPIDILITSYVVLTYTAQGRLKDAFPAVRWLITQKNSFGGFASSQDTAVGLQALSEYAAKSIRPDTNLNIKVSGGDNVAEFKITKDNALVLQIREWRSVPPKVDITADGIGNALVEVDVTFFTSKPVLTPSFDVSLVLLDDELNSFNLMICTKSRINKPTGMVVQQVSIPSGFTPELDSIGEVAHLKRKERTGNSVNVYFDNIGKISTCYSIRMTRSDKIARTQENYVRTWVYYDPKDQSTDFWQPKALRDARVCDLCDVCCS